MQVTMIIILYLNVLKYICWHMCVYVFANISSTQARFENVYEVIISETWYTL